MGGRFEDQSDPSAVPSKTGELISEETASTSSIEPGDRHVHQVFHKQPLSWHELRPGRTPSLVNPGFEVWPDQLAGATSNVEPPHRRERSRTRTEGVNYIFGRQYALSFRAAKTSRNVLTSGFLESRYHRGQQDARSCSAAAGGRPAYQTQTDEGQIAVSMLDAQTAELSDTFPGKPARIVPVEQSGVTPLLERARVTCVTRSWGTPRHSRFLTPMLSRCGYLEVRATAVPEPETYALMLAGLAPAVVAGKEAQNEEKG
ncbi:MAG: hypothetical protein IPK20_19160 [Betaproteobacteria bacterium]|nr:hypothetical protein [Betaproteobacteria bacterium]